MRFIFLTIFAIMFLVFVLVPPNSVFASPFLYISNQDQTKLYVVDLSTQQITNTITLSSPPSGICGAGPLHPNDVVFYNDKVFVTVPGGVGPGCTKSELKIVDLSTSNVNTITTDSTPSGLKVYGGNIYVLNRYGNTIQKVDPLTETISLHTSFTNPNPGSINQPIYFEIVYENP